MSKVYRFLPPLLALWLVTWIVLSWAAIQDDALIHLRYADNLFLTHHITYDGLHPSYGASSLLYVALLAFLRSFITSPNLPRAVSTAAHLLLFVGVALIFFRSIPQRASLARLLVLTLLFFLSSPSSVRWLDDGMETGLALCFVLTLCFTTFRESLRPATSAITYLAFTLLAFFTILLRTELLLLAGLCFLILTYRRVQLAGHSGHVVSSPRSWLPAALQSSHLLLGSLLALALILLRMHVLLPDTALAKSHGPSVWPGVLDAAAITLAGALSFGAGLLVFWLLTIFLLLRAHRLLSLPVLLANSVFPIVLTLAALRGQEIQGARYLVWTFFFSALWNILELATPEPSQPIGTSSELPGKPLVYAFLVLFLLVQPVEARLMYRVLTARAHTLAFFETQHLNTLHGQLGVAFDVGYIGYFSQANICDLAGLVNGRDAARLTNDTRAAACAARHPDFIFGNLSQIELMQRYMPLTGWQVCDHFNFVNVSNPDTHYLVLPPATAASVCHQTSGEPPYPVSNLLPPA